MIKEFAERYKLISKEDLELFAEKFPLSIDTNVVGRTTICASITICSHCPINEKSKDVHFECSLNTEAEEYLRTKHPEYFI